MADEAVAKTLARISGADQPVETSDEVRKTLTRMASGGETPTPPPPPTRDAPPVVVGRPRGTYMEGGVFSKATDALSTLQYLAAGVVAGKTPWEAVASRSSWEDVLEQAGAPPGIPRTIAGVALDMTLDPAWLVTPEKVVANVGKIGAVRKVAETAEAAYSGSKLERVVDKVGEQLVYAYKVPEVVKKAARDSRQLEHVLSRPAIEAHKKIKALGETAQEPMRIAMEFKDPAMKHAAQQTAIASGVDGAKFLDAQEFARKASDDVGRELVNQGRITPETFDEMTGRYLRRTYLRHEDTISEIGRLRAAGDPYSLALADDLDAKLQKLETRFRQPKKFGVKAEVSAHRTLSDEEAKAYGLVDDVGFRVARGIQLGAKEAARASFLNKVAATQASTERLLGYVQMPKSERLGALSEKWLPEPVAKFVQSNFEAPGKWAKFIATPLSYWKAAKVALSPAPMARNAFMSNPILLNFAGVPFHKMPSYMRDAIKAIRAVDHPELAAGINPMLVEAARTLKGSETARFIESELKEIFTHLNAGGESMLAKMRGPIDGLVEFGGNWYSAGELLGKTMAARHAIDLPGATASSAVDFAQHALFDYSEVPPLVQTLRQNGIVPFAAFPYFATKATAQALWSRPATVGRLGRAFRDIEAGNPDNRQEQAVAPKWMKDLEHVFTPLRDNKGRHLVFDATYVLPFSDIADVGDGDGIKRALAASPFATLIYDVANNKSAFTGREIAPPEILTGDAKAMKGIAMKKMFDYVYKFALPSWAPSILPGYPEKLQLTSGGYAFRDFERAIKDRPDFFGTGDWKSKAIWAALMVGNQAGIKLRPFDVPKESQARYKDYQHDLKAIHSRMQIVAMDEEMTREQKQGLISKLKDDLINVHRGFRAGP